MPDLAAPETTRSDALVSVPAGRAAPGAEQQGEQERERPGGRSPRAAPAAMAAELANEPGAAMPSLVARLQREYGNAYTREVVSRVRGRGGAGRPAEAPAVFSWDTPDAYNHLHSSMIESGGFGDGIQ